MPLLKVYEHLSGICSYEAALSLLLVEFNNGKPAPPAGTEGTLHLSQAQTSSSTKTTSRQVLGEVANPPSEVASPEVVARPLKPEAARKRASANASSEFLKVATNHVWNVVEALEKDTTALVHKQNLKGIPVTKLVYHSQSRYFQMIRSSPGWETTYPESLPRSWGSPLSQASVIRLFRLAQLCTYAEAEPLLQQQLESQSQTSRLSLLSIEAVRKVMWASRILCDMSTRDPGSIVLTQARTASPHLDDSAGSGSDSVLSSDHGFLDDYEPVAAAGCGNIHVQPSSSTSEGARGVPNPASQVDYSQQFEYEAVGELVNYFDFLTADPSSTGQLFHQQGHLHEAAQSGVHDESGLTSKEESIERPELMTPSRKRGRADSATQLDSCKRHNVSVEPTNPGQLHYQGKVYDPSRSGGYDESGSNFQKELMAHHDRGRVDSATHIDSYSHRNIFEQFPDLEFDSTKTPWCPAAGLDTSQFDTLPIYSDSSDTDGWAVVEHAQWSGGQRDLDAWMGVF